MNYTSLNLIFIIFFIFFLNSIAQVRQVKDRHKDYTIVKSVYANNELCGTFCRTNLEITFYNPSNSDSQEGVFNFSTLENSFVTDMWLEINGEYQKAETLYRKTGERIYNRIVRKRSDPALLIKVKNGGYSLSVFPVNSKEERKVRIEFYSVLEGKVQNIAHWFLKHIPVEKEYLEINYTLPSTSYINYGKYFSNKKFIKSSHNKVINGNIKRTEVDKLNFDVYLGIDKFTVNDAMVNNDFKSFVMEIQPNYIFKLKNNSVFFENINQIITLLNNDNSVFLRNESNSKFVNGFIRYLSSTFRLYQNFTPELPNWIYINSFNFIQNNYSITQILNRRATETVIYCPYLQHYISCNVISLHEETSNQKSSGYLYKNLAKLVIEENDKRVVKIREQELSNENILDEIDEEISPIFFMAVERMPKPIGGIEAIQRKVFYPKKYVDSKIEGKVYIKAWIDKSGFVTRTEILKGIADVLDSIALRAVQLTKFIPGRQRDKNVKVIVSIPILFEIGKTRIGNYLENELFEKIEIYEKFLSINHNDKNEWMLSDDLFDKENNEKLEYTSNKSFNILKQYPDHIKYILTGLEEYTFDKIGLVIDNISYLFTKK